MISDMYLPPHLERFVREQVATGRFFSEGEVLRTALRLLEASSPADPPAALQSADTTTRSGRPSSRPPAPERWEVLRERRVDTSVTGATAVPARRSPRGLLADLRSDLSFDDFKDARDELWTGLRPGETR
jgi:putative addiction module CopG family antidote